MPSNHFFLCYDGSEAAEHASSELFKLARPGDKCTVFTVTRPGGGGLVSAAVTDDKKTRIMTEGQARDVEMIPLEKEGDPRKLILEESQECDYIVMGSRGLGAIARMTQGSVSEHVVRFSKRPVIVTRK